MASKKNKGGSSLPPVKKLVLSDENRKLRIILLVAFLMIAVLAFYFGFRSVLDTKPGWGTVECASGETNCSSDFVFSYHFGKSGQDSSYEEKVLVNLYSQLAVDAWRIFNTDVQSLSAQPNTQVTVDPALDNALSLIQQYNNRWIYLAPIYAEYDHMFVAQSDAEAKDYDPAQNPEQAQYLAELTSYASDPSMVDIRLLGDNQVMLEVAQEYLTYAQEQDITTFVDFGWMKNAFVADYLADVLVEYGYTNGFLASYDGYTRNLYDQNETFSLNLFDRVENSIYLAGTMQYDKPISIVFLRNYPLSQKDQYGYYTFQSGRVVNTLVDLATGVNKSATDSLVCYSYSQSCAEVLMQAAPVYVADSLDKGALHTMKQDGVYAIWAEGTTLLCNDSELSIKLNGEAGLDYGLEYVK